MFRRIMSASMAVLLCALLTVPAAASTRIKMSSSSITITVGETKPLRVKFTPADAAEALTWSTSNDGVAAVDDNGLVTGVGSGTASVTAETAGGLSASCRVTVRKVGEEVKVRAVEISLPTMTVRVNQTRMLWATVSPSDATDQDVFWSSSDNNVAEVDGEGIVTGIAPGKATITAETGNGRSDACEVTVPGTVVKGLIEDTSNTESPSSGELITSAEMKTAVENAARSTVKGTIGIAAFKDKSAIPPAVLNAAAFTAASADRDVRLQFITTGDEGKTQGWLIIDPQKAKNRIDDLKPEVFISSAKTASVQKLFNKYFSNSVTVIYCTHTGSYDMEVQLAAKVDLSGLNKDRLKFYTYDPTANSYHILEIASYTIDKNGYLRFSTSTGGAIIISDEDMSKR